MRNVSRVACISTTLFILGTLFTSFLNDHLLLFKAPVPESAYGLVERYYHTLINSPAGFKALLHAVIFVDILSIAIKLAYLTDEAVWFDGGSLFLMMISLGFYIGVEIPALQQLFPYAPPQFESGNLLAYLVRPRELYPKLSLSEQRETLGVVSASNCICMVLLVGVVILQVGDWHVEATVEAEYAKEVAEALEAESKKTK